MNTGTRRITLEVPDIICDKYEVLAKRFGTTSHDLMVEALQGDIEECEYSWGKIEVEQ